LAEANPFEWDSHVDFSESDHTYTVKGSVAQCTVTELVKAAFPNSATFDGRAICKSNLSRWRTNASNRYHNLVARTDDDDEAIDAVLALWERNRELGTLAHKAVELKLNGESDKTIEDVRTELGQYMVFHNRSTAAGWEVLRTELALYYERVDGTIVGGQIDVLYKDEAGTLRVVDVKRSDKQLHSSSPSFGKTGVGPAASLPDTDHFKYSLQCWIYSVMLARLTGADVKSPLLVQVHPELNKPNIVHCAPLKEVAERVLSGEVYR
jgi:hypothetical protein